MKAALAAIPGRLINLPAVPLVARVSVAAAQIGHPEVRVDQKTPDDIDEIALRLIGIFRAGQHPERRDLNQAPWCIWEGKRPLADIPLVLERLLAHIRESGKRSAFRRLAAVYLLKFEPLQTSPKAAVIRQVAETLRSIAPGLTGTFTNAARDLQLFDPDEAPSIIASRAIVSGTSPTKVLEGAGIRNLAAEGGLAEAAFLAGLGQLAANRKIAHPERLARIKEWGLRQDGTVLYEQHRGPLVDALVEPQGNTIPEQNDLDLHLRFLIPKFGDPRINQANWKPMRSTATVRRWLTSVSLRQFLDVVDRGALVHQWQYRRAFWEAVNQRELISDAWVIFDEFGDQTARRLYRVEAPYARFITGGGRQIERGHAVLLLKVGAGIIAEWSHNGTCNVWHSMADPSVPVFNKPTYRTNEVRVPRAQNPDFKRVAIRHDGSDGYRWQSTVADEIYALTNIRVMESEYRLS